jgi:MFS transporter, ACS family, D-galactonate transporter
MQTEATMQPTLASDAANMAHSKAQFMSPGRRWAVVGLLCLSFIFAYIDRVNLSVTLALPEMKQLFRLNDADRGLLNSAFFWSYALLQIPAGWLVDRLGSKRALGYGFLLWSLVSAATGLTNSFTQLFMVRLLLGVGEAVNTPACMRWIRFNMPEHRRGLAIGLCLAAAKIGPAIGMVVAAWLTTAYGWRTMFLILGLGGMLWLIPFSLLVTDEQRKKAKAGNQTTTSTGGAEFWASMRSPALWGSLVAAFCYHYFLYFCMTWMPAYFVEQRGLKLASMTLFSFMSFAGMAVVATAAGWTADHLIARGGDAVRIRKSFAIAGLLVGSTQLIGAFSASQNVALFFAIFSLSGLGLMTANFWALTSTLFPGPAVGRIVGVQNCAANIAGIVAPILTGWLRVVTGSYRAPMIAVGVFLLLGLTSYLFVIRRQYAPAQIVGP